MRAARFLLYLLLLLPSWCLGNEGFWLPVHLERLRGVDLQLQGLQLTNEEIYSINHSSLKDAIISFNGYCSGEVVSKAGLFLTNYHCAQQEVHKASKDQNLIENGFWAIDRDQEIAELNSQVTFLVRMEDVTQEILGQVENLSNEQERLEKIDLISEEIVANTVGDTHYTGEVKSFFFGNEFYLFIYEVFEDVRLVGVPPESIGQFGNNRDNWEWPSHTADFALFRIYADENGKPAAYSSRNVPLVTHALTISLDGILEGDNTLVMGYPGKTARSITNHGIQYSLDHVNSNKQEIIKVKKDVYQNLADSDTREGTDPIELKELSNYEKFYRGQSEVTDQLKVVNIKEKQLSRLKASLKPQDLMTLEKIEQHIQETNLEMAPLQEYNIYFVEWVFISELLIFAYNFSSLYQPLVDKYPKQAYQEKIDKLIKQTTRHFENYDPARDLRMTAAMLALFYENISTDQQPKTIKKLGDRYHGDYQRWCEKLFKKTFFNDPAKVNQFLARPNKRKLIKDPAYRFMRELLKDYYGQVAPNLKQSRASLNKYYRSRHNILCELDPGLVDYPEANGTLRISLGQAKKFTKFDGAEPNLRTSLSGLIAKCESGIKDYQAPDKLCQLYQKKQFGRYADQGDIPIAFLTDNDITSGSSGSPVLNSSGELVGIVSDSNWESLAGDFQYMPELQRSINIDIRYVLFIVDHFAGAKNLIDEMIIRSPSDNHNSR